MYTRARITPPLTKYWQGAESHNPLSIAQKILVDHVKPDKDHTNATARKEGIEDSEPWTKHASQQSSPPINAMRGC